MWPSWKDIGREAAIVIGGAVVAALIIGQLPGLKKWIADQWGDTPKLF